MKISNQLLVITLLSLLLVGCSDKPKKAIDFGTYDSGVYTNDYFNLEVTVPDEWHVLDDESRIAVMKQGSKIVAGDNDNLNAVFNAADLKNMNLLIASKYPMGAPVTFNPSFTIIAEKVKHLPGIIRGRDYHFHTKYLMKSSPLKISFTKDIYAKKIDETTFDIMEFEVEMGQMTISQKQYVAIINGYALLFGLTYSEQTDLESLQKIIQAIKLKA